MPVEDALGISRRLLAVTLEVGDVGVEELLQGRSLSIFLCSPGRIFLGLASPLRDFPFALEMLEPVCRLLPQRVGDSKMSRIAEDRRFAEAVYKVGLAGGVMDRMRYLDLADGD